MKTVLMILTMTLFSSSAFAGFTLHCKVDEDSDMNAGLVYVGGNELVCNGPDDKYYRATLGGVGPSLFYDWSGKVSITCSGRKSRISGDYGALRVSASVGKGIMLATAANSRFSFCAIAGLLTSAGVGAEIGSLHIYETEAPKPKSPESPAVELQPTN